jgi:hypothetical protein
MASAAVQPKKEASIPTAVSLHGHLWVLATVIVLDAKPTSATGVSVVVMVVVGRICR